MWFIYYRDISIENGVYQRTNLQECSTLYPTNSSRHFSGSLRYHLHGRPRKPLEFPKKNRGFNSRHWPLATANRGPSVISGYHLYRSKLSSHWTQILKLFESPVTPRTFPRISHVELKQFFAGPWKNEKDLWGETLAKMTW